MPLDVYRRKRDFRRTAEPAGTQHERRTHGLFFCVQKHAARRLHYDFRLELDGVLKSWAVPKGPSFDPSEKRLAVHVEDHPIEYGTFEGTIPAGEYGAGTVLLWDRGEWIPREDPHEGYAKGKLKFELVGEKLRGGWTLARMGGRSSEGGKNWLLLKERDAVARPLADGDVLDERPESVAGDPSTADAPRAKLPAELAPQLATLTSDVPAGPEWIHELKYDGYRALCRVERGKARLFSRSGKEWTQAMAGVARAAAALPIDSAWLDGEVVVLGADGRTSFQALQNALSASGREGLTYIVFDAPFLDGRDLRALPLVTRKHALAAALARADEATRAVVRYAEHVDGDGEAFFRHACRVDIEGIVSKRRDAPYEHKRTTTWRKVRCQKRQEFVIGGFTAPAGGRVGFGSLLLGVNENGGLRYAGRVGTGFDDRTLRALHARLQALERETSPFAPGPVKPPKGARFVRPELVGEVAFTEWTSDGQLRHPTFQGLRTDKSAAEVVRERPVAPPRDDPPAREALGARSPRRRADSHGGRDVRASGRSAAAAVHDRPKRSTRRRDETTVPAMRHDTPASPSRNHDATVAGVRLTHPDRVFWPEAGVTKLDLAHYYEHVAPWMLPYVAHRPLSLLRAPEGHTGERFFHKHVDKGWPDALRRVQVREAGKTISYVMVVDAAGLVALAQMGVLEIHPWGSRDDRLEQPDVLIFDMDPGEGVSWRRLVEATAHTRVFLHELGLTSFVKTTGGKGLHVVVPIVPHEEWDEVKAFTEGVARTLTRRDPGLFVAKMGKAARPGKIYVDYVRNTRGQTAVGTYSTRARPGAPVSAPLRWDEILGEETADRWNVRNLPRRLASLKEDPWQEFAAVKQRLTKAILGAVR